MLRWGACKGRRAEGVRGVVLVLASTMAVAILLASGVAQAIINGEPDRGPNAHSYVGALVSVPPSGEFKGQRIPLCSGTLISARVFLSAGHCTEFLIKEGLPTYVSFDPTYKPGASQVISATPYTHPKFCFPTSEDKGKCSLPPKRPEIVGALPRDVRYEVVVAVLEEGQRLTTVGYGATGFHLGGEPPPRPVYTDDRYRGMVRLLTTNNAVGDQLLKTSGIGIVGGGEGSCFGDSGGPLFMPDQETIVGVTSFGTAPLCKGPAYNQRMDIPQVLKWVRSFP